MVSQDRTCCCLLQIMVTAATSCAAVWLSQYCGAKHTFTVATVGVTTVAAYGICCAFLTMHDQASSLLSALVEHDINAVVWSAAIQHSRSSQESCSCACQALGSASAGF